MLVTVIGLTVHSQAQVLGFLLLHLVLSDLDKVSVWTVSPMPCVIVITIITCTDQHRCGSCTPSFNVQGLLIPSFSQP